MRSINDLLPEPTKELPFAQFDFLASRFILTRRSESSKQISKSSFKLFKEFLVKSYSNSIQNVDVLFYFSQNIHVYTVVNFRKHLLDFNQINRTLKTINSYVAEVQAFLNYAFDHSLLEKQPYRVKTFTEQRTSDAYGPYSKNEIQCITDCITVEQRFFKSQFIGGRGYVKIGCGRDPRAKSNKRPGKTNGWKLNNTVWYFENVLNAQVHFWNNDNLKGEHRDFFKKGIMRYPGRLEGFYNDLNILPIVNSKVVGLYALKLAVETGLNPESIFGLKVDCFKRDHPITNKPYIRYSKPRSGGEKDLVFFVDEGTEIHYLKGPQALLVERTIADIIELTALFRLTADESCQDILFLFQSESKRDYGRIVQFDKKSSFLYCKYLAEKYLLVDDKGKPLRLWFVRFRSTMITEMARVGKNIFEILAQAGHRSLKTTMGYIYRNNLEVEYQADIKRALENIHENRLKVANTNTQTFEAVVSNCLDVFNPPSFLNASKTEAIMPCHRVHQCLSCPNVVISKHHLPILFKYYTDIISSLAFQEQGLVFQRSYERTVAIIEHIFNNKSFFTVSELEEAKRISLQLPELFIDPQVSTGYVS